MINEEMYDIMCKNVIEYEKKIDLITFSNRQLRITLKAEQDAHNALRERLRELEWCGVPGNDICYVCNGDRKHNENCWIGNALKGG